MTVWRGREAGQCGIGEVGITTAPKGSSANKIFLPERIVRIRFTSDFDVPPDRRLAGMLEPYNGRLTPNSLRNAKEAPVPTSMVPPVLLLNPASAFCRMFPACPLPKTGEDGVVDFAEGAAADNMPVIVGPTAYFAIQHKDQIGCRFSQPRPYGFSDAFQKGSKILPGGLDEQFSIRISAHILSEKIEARGHVRDDRFHGGEFKPAFAQEAFDQRFDLFQQFFRPACDHEVVRITDEIHTGILSAQGWEAFLLRITFPKKLLQSIQRMIGQRRGGKSRPAEFLPWFRERRASPYSPMPATFAERFCP